MKYKFKNIRVWAFSTRNISHSTNGKNGIMFQCLMVDQYMTQKLINKLPHLY